MCVAMVFACKFSFSFSISRLSLRLFGRTFLYLLYLYAKKEQKKSVALLEASLSIWRSVSSTNRIKHSFRCKFDWHDIIYFFLKFITRLENVWNYKHIYIFSDPVFFALSSFNFYSSFWITNLNIWLAYFFTSFLSVARIYYFSSNRFFSLVRCFCFHHVQSVLYWQSLFRAHRWCAKIANEYLHGFFFVCDKTIFTQ